MKFRYTNIVVMIVLSSFLSAMKEERDRTSVSPLMRYLIKEINKQKDNKVIREARDPLKKLPFMCCSTPFYQITIPGCAFKKITLKRTRKLIQATVEIAYERAQINTELKRIEREYADDNAKSARKSCWWNPWGRALPIPYSSFSDSHSTGSRYHSKNGVPVYKLETKWMLLRDFNIWLDVSPDL